MQASLFHNGADELAGGELRCANLQQEEVGVNHRLAEVTLDVGHGLTLDL